MGSAMLAAEDRLESIHHYVLFNTAVVLLSACGICFRSALNALSGLALERE
jgi:hypothetical protein